MTHLVRHHDVSHHKDGDGLGSLDHIHIVTS